MNTEQFATTENDEDPTEEQQDKQQEVPELEEFDEDEFNKLFDQLQGRT